MANMLDYIDWRGDLTFDIAPFNDIDNIIFSQLSYIEFAGIVPPPSKRADISIYDAAKKLENMPGQRTDLGVLVPGTSISELLEKVSNAKRYSDLKLSSYINHVDYDKQIQFAALTVDIGNRTKYLAFRGTDDTLVGWQEDFNMSFLDTVPSQNEALAYVDIVSETCDGIILGGHSKGGNLAVFAGVHCSPAAKSKLIGIYNNDGPGFSAAMLENENYLNVKNKIHTFVPQSSVVGMLLERAEKITVVKSTQSGLHQHDAFSWEVLGDKFVYAEKLTRESELIEKSLKAWLATMEVSKRKEFVEALFAMLSGADAKTLTELSSDKIKLIRSIVSLSPEMRDVIISSLRNLLSESAKNIHSKITSKHAKRKNSNS